MKNPEKKEYYPSGVMIYVFILSSVFVFLSASLYYVINVFLLWKANPFGLIASYDDLFPEILKSLFSRYFDFNGEWLNLAFKYSSFYQRVLLVISFLSIFSIGGFFYGLLAGTLTALYHCVRKRKEIALNSIVSGAFTLIFIIPLFFRIAINELSKGDIFGLFTSSTKILILLLLIISGMTVKTISDSDAGRNYLKKFFSLTTVNNRNIVKTPALILVLFAVIYATAFFGAQGNRNMGENIILISIDTLRADHLGCYGYGRDTSPGIDKLAENGIIYFNAVAASSWTLPSHMSIFTSLYPSEHGVVNSTLKLDDFKVTLPEVLKKNGYTNLGIISNRLVSSTYGFNRDFDFYDDESNITLVGKHAHWITDTVIQHFNKLRYVKKFFYFIHYNEIHYPYVPPAPLDRMFYPGYKGKVRGWGQRINRYFYSSIDNDDLRQFVSLYDGEIRYLDFHLNRLFQHLKETGLDKNTTIIITSDHGEEFKEHQMMFHAHSLYDELIRVPLIIVPSPRINMSQSGNVIDYPVSHIDIAPTVMGITGIDYKGNFQGIDLTDIQNKDFKRKVFSELPILPGLLPFKSPYSGITAVIGNEYKLIHSVYKDVQNDSSFPSCNAGIYKEKEQLGLYNMKNDKEEKTNLADSSEYAEILSDYKETLLKWIEEREILKKKLYSDAKEENKVILSNSEKEQLKTLGYFQ